MGIFMRSPGVRWSWFTSTLEGQAGRRGSFDHSHVALAAAVDPIDTYRRMAAQCIELQCISGGMLAACLGMIERCTGRGSMALSVRTAACVAGVFRWLRDADRNQRR